MGGKEAWKSGQTQGREKGGKGKNKNKFGVKNAIVKPNSLYVDDNNNNRNNVNVSPVVTQMTLAHKTNPKAMNVKKG